MAEDNFPLEMSDVTPLIGEQALSIIALRKEITRLQSENALLRDMTAKPESEAVS